MSQSCMRYSTLAISISLLLSTAPYAHAENSIVSSKSHNKQEIPPAKKSLQKSFIGDIDVSDQSDQDATGYDNVYDKNIANSYIGKEEFERFKGVSPGDMFKGVVGVFSGETRNGGAIDPNIRGVQGQGRVIVTVDGTEQAITVWRGYYGSSNRNYLDPNMIRSIAIEKGPSLSQDVSSSIGGGIAIKTININDVVRKGDIFGINVKTDIGNNSIKPRFAKLIYGEDYRDLDHKLINRYMFDDKDINIRTHNRNEYVLHGVNDLAYRVALGFRQDRFDFMLAYSHRKNGNFASGHRGADGYSMPFTEKIRQSGRVEYFIAAPIDPFLPFAANVYYPGHEVLNTSNTMDTLLIKHNWRISDLQALHFSYRHTQLYFGDIMPSRLYFIAPNVNKLPQWPEGQVAQRVANITYKALSDNYPYLNFRANLWFNHTDSKLNTGGGFPRYPTEYDTLYDKVTPKDLSMDGSLIETSSSHNYNNRWGINLKNDFRLTAKNLLTLSGRFQNERMTSAHPSDSNYRVFTFWPPREGRRQEYHFGMNYVWTPIDRLNLTAGLQYNTYWSVDDFINNRIDEGKEGTKRLNERTGVIAEYKERLTPEEHIIYTKYQTLRNAYFGVHHTKRSTTPEVKKHFEQIYQQYHDMDRKYGYKYFSSIRIDKGTGLLYRDVKLKLNVNSTTGLLHKEENPFYNGKKDINEKVIHPITGEKINRYIVNPLSNRTGNILDYSLGLDDGNPLNAKLMTKEPKRKASAWAPVLSASLELSNHWRVYLRYAEAVRLPSLYEDTGNISGLRFIRANNQFDNERSQTIEFGSVYDFSALVNTEHRADIKLSYYDMQIHNVFERTTNGWFIQMDKQLISGIELQARYDSGRVFGNLSASYNIKTKVCDEDSYITMNVFNKLKIPDCIDGGYPGGSLRTSIPPKYSIHANLGIRLLDQKLKLGNRFIYHSKVVNKDETYLSTIIPNLFRGSNNNPVRWNPIFTIDSYINYQITPDTSIELVGTNMLDEYYLDPLTRSMMPAPGRTFKLSITSQF
ncbi:TonB-dependent receptor [Moellerella wisconsensis]|uniref:TonB-dependent receptor domain-containing protein n=1 Tax=Moellerella wisconsensis TaxID=158849 RepID=UPI003075FA13